MKFGSVFSRQGGFVSAVRETFRSRELFIHDGARMRRIHIPGKVQIAAAATGFTTLALSMVAVAQIAVGTPAVAGAIGSALSADISVARMNAKVASMEAEMATIRRQAAAHAQRIEARQAVLDAMITGKGGVPKALPASFETSAATDKLVAPLDAAEAHQNLLAAHVVASNEARYRETASALGRVGINAGRFHRVAGAMGGPYEPIAEGVTPAVKGQADPQFRALFQSWKRLEQLQQGIVAIPSQRPVDAVAFTSGFGVRSDPFRGGAAMHAGVDIPGPLGTSIYATADGIVGRAQWANGYGNLVELNHGQGIQTRYGHLSQILVQPGSRVTRGQLIARMGSTGRSTGSHLHYEVRLDGHAVNPMPFLQSASYLMAMQTRGANVALGGPRGGDK
jgi:murein DD-endopeptidase MepM/ murein hydrolase activator NlpD